MPEHISTMQRPASHPHRQSLRNTGRNPHRHSRQHSSLQQRLHHQRQHSSLQHSNPQQRLHHQRQPSSRPQQKQLAPLSIHSTITDSPQLSRHISDRHTSPTLLSSPTRSSEPQQQPLSPLIRSTHRASHMRSSSRVLRLSTILRHMVRTSSISQWVCSRVSSMLTSTTSQPSCSQAFLRQSRSLS